MVAAREVLITPNPRQKMSQNRQIATRRDLLKTSILAGVGLAAGSSTPNSKAADAAPTGKPFRVAHMTDMHVEPGPRKAGEGWAAALKSLHTKLDRKPDLIITGGDHVMDSFVHEPKDVAPMWDLYQSVLKDNTDIPVHSTIGNHDVFGWGAPEKVTPEAAGYGKALYLEKMKLEKSYHSFDAGGWHLICLDNISRRATDPKSYVGELDEEQNQWLVSDLKQNASDKPVCVVSHIPLLAACVFFDNKRYDDKLQAYSISDAIMHRNVRSMLGLLRQHNVKLCLSGHIHLVDRIDYAGVSYICDGAVSGNWWKGPRQEFPEGYGVIDFYPDGRFEHRYQTYGWIAPQV
jgi:3',5'-cyclic AMP phosphodiesterase CpdA